MGREAWEKFPKTDHVALKNQPAREMFATFFAHRGMEERFTYAEKHILRVIAGKFWQERERTGENAEMVATAINIKDEQDIFGRKIKSPGLGEVLRVGAYNNLESWAVVEENGSEGKFSNPFYYFANIFGLQSKDIVRKRVEELKANRLVRAVLVATNIDYQRGERPAARAGGVRELNLFEQVVKDLSGVFESVITLDTHSPGTAFKCFEHGIPILDLTAMPLLVDAADKLELLEEELVVAVGDEGALEMGVMVKELLVEKKNKQVDIVPGFKRKINNKTHVAFLEEDLQKVSGKTVVIAEDIVDSGGTMLETIAKLKKHGAKKIVILATHAVLTTPEGREGAERLGKQEDVLVIMTDSARGELPEKVVETQKSQKNIYLVDVIDNLMQLVKFDRVGALREAYENGLTSKNILRSLGLDVAAWLNEKYVVAAEQLAESRRSKVEDEFRKMGALSDVTITS